VGIIVNFGGLNMNYENTKSDINLIKSAFKNDFLTGGDVIDVNFDTEGRIVSSTLTRNYKLDSAYEEELKEEIMQSFTGSYGKNFYVCRNADACTKKKPTKLTFQQTIEMYFNDVDIDSSIFNPKNEQLNKIIDMIAPHLQDFVTAKMDTPSNYVLHIARYVINPTANNSMLKKKSDKHKSTCYDMPMLFIWADAYMSNSVTALVKNDKAIERQRVAYLAKYKHPLFMLSYGILL